MPKVKILLKLGISTTIVINLITLLLLENPSDYFSLFSYFSSDLLNIVFSIFFLLFIWFQSKGEVVLFQLFLLFIFVDTIVVYHHKINFLMHVLAFAVISRLLIKVIRHKKKKKKIEDHLIG